MRLLKSSGCRKVLMNQFPEREPIHMWVVTQLLGLVQAGVGGSLAKNIRNWPPGVRPGKLLVKIGARRNAYGLEYSQNERIVCLFQQLSPQSDSITSFAEKSTVKVGLKSKRTKQNTTNQSISLMPSTLILESPRRETTKQDRMCSKKWWLDSFQISWETLIHKFKIFSKFQTG